MAGVITVLDRYVLRCTLKPLTTAMAIGLMVLLAERMVRLLDTTLDKQNSFAVVFELLAYLVPHYLGLAIPAALFLGLLFGFNKIAKDSELDAMMASGLGLHRIARPVLLLSLLISIISLPIFGWVQPYTRYAYRALIYNVSNVEVFYLAEAGIFMRSGTRTFILDSIERGTGKVKGVFLYDDRGVEGAEIVTAEEAQLVKVPDKRRPVLVLTGGKRTTLPQLEGAETPPLPKQAGDFSESSTPLGKEEDEPFRGRGGDHRELTLPELAGVAGNTPALAAELHKRLVNIVTPVLMPILAVPFAIGSRRSASGYKIGVALLLLIILHESIEQGAILARAGLASPYVSIWLPVLAMMGFAALNFYRTAFTLRPSLLDPLVDLIAAAGKAVGGVFIRRRSAP